MSSGWAKEILLNYLLNKEVIVSDPKVVNKSSIFFIEGNLNSVKSGYVRGNRTSNRE